MCSCPVCVPTGLLVIGPLQNFGGWKAVWYFLVASTIAGMGLLAPLVHKEIFNHDGHVRHKRKIANLCGGTYVFRPAQITRALLQLFCSRCKSVRITLWRVGLCRPAGPNHGHSDLISPPPSILLLVLCLRRRRRNPRKNPSLSRATTPATAPLRPVLEFERPVPSCSSTF